MLPSLKSAVRVLIDYRAALRARTGIGEWLHSLVTALANIDPGERAFDLALFSSSGKDRLTQAILTNVAVSDRRTPVRLLNYCRHQLEWPPVEAVTGSRFDVVHSPHPPLIPTCDAVQAVTIMDLDFPDHPERAETEIQRDHPSLAALHANRVDKIVVPSEDTAYQFDRRLRIDPASIALCPCGPASWSTRTLWPAPGHILFVGTVSPRKNIGVLLEAYAVLLERRSDLPPLVLAGRPSPQAADRLKRIELVPLACHVQCTGYLNNDELKRYYDDARLLVLPSLEEGFGLPVLEAMTLGFPVVPSNRGALPELVGAAGHLADPRSPKNLANAIEQMINDRELVRACVEKGLANAGRYRWHASAARRLDTYTDAVSKRSRNSPAR